jgi:predicted AAA+ superfamily ATPase
LPSLISPIRIYDIINTYISNPIKNRDIISDNCRAFIRRFRFLIDNHPEGFSIHTLPRRLRRLLKEDSIR